MRHIAPQKLFLVLYFLLGIPILVGIVYVVCTLFFSFPVYFQWSAVQVYFLLLLEPLLVISLVDVWLLSKKSQKNISPWVLFLIFSVLNAIAFFFLTNYYRHPGRIQYSAVRIFLGLEPIIWVILGIVILLCFVKLLGRKTIELWNTLPFSDYTGIEGLSGKKIILILSGFFIVGLALRLINLDQFPPYVDEYIHTRTAFSIYNGNPVIWGRSFLPVTLPVLLSYKIFGVNLWAARFPMILINMLAIFPLYFLYKRISKFTGLIAVFLFVCNPWIIAAARTVREYAVIPLYFFTVAVFLLDLLEWEGKSLKTYLKQQWWKIIILALVAAYAVYDSESILKILMLNYGVFGILFLLKLIRVEARARYRIAGGIVGLMGIIFFIVKSRILNKVINISQAGIGPSSGYWSMLTTSTTQHWFALFPEIAYIILAALFLLTLVVIFQKQNKRNNLVSYAFLMFSGLLIFLTFFLANPKLPARVRYGVLLENWYVILTALFLYLLFQVLFPRLKKWRFAPVAVILAAGLLLINFNSIDTILNYKGGGALQVTGEKHYLMDPAYRFMLPQLKDGDTLVTDYLGVYDELYEKQFLNVNKISFLGTVIRGKTPWTVLVNKYPEGWFSLTSNSRIEKNGPPFHDSQVDNKTVYYLGRLGESYLWHWVTNP